MDFINASAEILRRNRKIQLCKITLIWPIGYFISLPKNIYWLFFFTILNFWFFRKYFCNWQALLSIVSGASIFLKIFMRFRITKAFYINFSKIILKFYCYLKWSWWKVCYKKAFWCHIFEIHFLHFFFLFAGSVFLNYKNNFKTLQFF